MPRPENLIGHEFKPGQSGNPAGRPPGSFSVKSELQKLMQIMLRGEHNALSDVTEDMPVARKIALNLALKAVADNDLSAIVRVMEQLDGKPSQPLGNDPENPLVSPEMVVRVLPGKDGSGT